MFSLKQDKRHYNPEFVIHEGIVKDLVVNDIIVKGIVVFA